MRKLHEHELVKRALGVNRFVEVREWWHKCETKMTKKRIALDMKFLH